MRKKKKVEEIFDQYAKEHSTGAFALSRYDRRAAMRFADDITWYFIEVKAEDTVTCSGDECCSPMLHSLEILLDHVTAHLTCGTSILTLRPQPPLRTCFLTRENILNIP
ncbi:MAG: hypothetical protein ACE5I5_03190 [Candidatus Heimdallarchaeota archaeon]